MLVSSRVPRSKGSLRERAVVKGICVGVDGNSQPLRGLAAHEGHWKLFTFRGRSRPKDIGGHAEGSERVDERFALIPAINDE